MKKRVLFVLLLVIELHSNVLVDIYNDISKKYSECERESTKVHICLFKKIGVTLVRKYEDHEMVFSILKGLRKNRS